MNWIKERKLLILLALGFSLASCSTISSKKSSKVGVADSLILDIEDAEKNLSQDNVKSLGGIEDEFALEADVESSDGELSLEDEESLSNKDVEGEKPFVQAEISDENSGGGASSNSTLDIESGSGLADQGFEDLPSNNFAQDSAGSGTSTKKLTPVLIENISFKYNDRGGVILIDAAGDFEFEQRIDARKRQLVLSLYPARLPKKLKRPYIMKDFPKSYFTSINSYESEEPLKVKIVVQMKGSEIPNIQKEGSSLVVMSNYLTTKIGAGSIAQSDVGSVIQTDVSQVAEGENFDQLDIDGEAVSLEDSKNKFLLAKTLSEFLANESKFYGDPISIALNDVEIKRVIEFISRESGVNMVIGDDVKGNVTVKLRNVPWDQVLITLLRSKDLGYIRQGNILHITTLKKLKETAKLANEIKKEKADSEPIHIRVFPISFSDVSELQPQVSALITSGKGKVIIDKRTSSLIVSDKKEVIDRVEKLIKELDLPPRQVLIEAKIIEAAESFERTIGINWGFNSSLTLSESGGLGGGPVVVESSLDIQNIQNSAPFRFGFTIGTLDFLGDITSAIALAEANGLAKVISSPRIVTINKQTATIQQKGEVLTASTTTSASGDSQTTSVDRTPLVLSLEVTPQITASNDVIMDLSLKREFPGAPLLGTFPVNTREAKSQVVVGDGETAVIGGIYQSTKNNSSSGVPGLKNIPIIGWLFKHKLDKKSKNELLMFVTPRQIKKSQRKKLLSL